MTIGTKRFSAGQPVEVRERVPGGVTERPWKDKWIPAVFSHYDRHGRPVVTFGDGSAKAYEDGTWLR